MNKIIYKAISYLIIEPYNQILKLNNIYLIHLKFMLVKINLYINFHIIKYKLIKLNIKVLLQGIFFFYF